MIVMDVKLDNFCAFEEFHLNLSYPKKVVNSYIEKEHLAGHPNFRYKKVNILMGSNATGKTTLGKTLMSIFNFISRKELKIITEKINDKKRQASFSVDFLPGDATALYRVEAVFAPEKEEEYTEEQLSLKVSSAKISNTDSYESCIKKLTELGADKETYAERLSRIPRFGWLFTYPMDAYPNSVRTRKSDNGIYTEVLKRVLQSLDPSIIDVRKSKEVENSYIIEFYNDELLIQDGEVIKKNILSSGTRYGIDIADIMAAVIGHENSFYYCDEKFSYINSDIEKASLSVMINALSENEQLFFTSHNTDLLDMPLPKHAFSFLKKERSGSATKIKCLYASDYLKRNTDSLRNAVDNDLFSIAPSLELIYGIQELTENKRG